MNLLRSHISLLNSEKLVLEMYEMRVWGQTFKDDFSSKYSVICESLSKTYLQNYTLKP